MKNFPDSKWAADCNLILAKRETEYLPPLGICLSCSRTRPLRSSAAVVPAPNANRAVQNPTAAINVNTSIIKRQLPEGQSFVGNGLLVNARTNAQRPTPNAYALPLCHVERSRDISYCFVFDERYRDNNERFLPATAGLGMTKYMGGQLTDAFPYSWFHRTNHSALSRAQGFKK
jgi:hypothetical protein